MAASPGAKNWVGVSDPLALTASLMTDSDRVAGGVPDGEGWGETPFPVVRMIRFAPSDTNPPPLCQMPACEFWSVPIPDSSLHIVVTFLVVVLTPTTTPR